MRKLWRHSSKCGLPKPFQVDAVVLKLTPLAKPRIEAEYGVLETLVKCLFQYRRKYIRKGARLLHIHIMASSSFIISVSL